MYFIRFNNVAVFAQESRKLTRNGIRYEIIDLDEETTFAEMCRKNPYANCKKVDYFEGSKNHIIPAYAMSFIKGIERVQQEITAHERGKKIDDLLG